MKNSFPLFLVLLVTFFHILNSAEAASSQLLTKGTAIVLAGDAIPAEKTAAQELKKYLHQITGRNFPIQEESTVASNTPQILVGNGKRARQLAPSVQWDALERDTIVLKTSGDTLILAGQRPRGSLYAVYQFLKGVAGCRWWTPTEHFIPHNPQLRVPVLDIVYTPPFYYRQMHVIGFSWNKDAAYQTLSRQNGQHQVQDADWGGHYSMLGFVHTFFQLIPPAQYFAAHPEWFSDAKNQNRPSTVQSAMPNGTNSQLCLTNAAVRQELIKNALDLIAKKPEAGIISISESDNENYCRCPQCLAFYEREGSWSGPLLDLVNQVAAAIHEQYPDFIVETLAYHGSEKPPKTVRPAQNVMIRLAPLGADFGHPINSQWNAGVRDNLLAWQKIAPQLFVWTYATNFHYYALPHPNWDSFADDLRFFAANNVKGVYVEGDNLSKGVGDFVQLRAWLTGKLLWNPQLDEKKLRHEFLTNYYGAAAPYLEQYLQLVQSSFNSKNYKLNSFNDDFSFMTLDVMNQATQLFEQAQRTVQNDAQLATRVRREKLSLDLAWLKFYKALQKEAQTQNAPWHGPTDPQAALAEFEQTFKQLGGGAVSLGGETLEAILPRLNAGVAADAPLPPQARGKAPLDFIDLPSGALKPGRNVARLVEDVQASHRQAMELDGNSSTWAASTYLENYGLILKGSRWRAYAVLRFAFQPGTDKTGKLLAIGAHDRTHGKYVAQKAITPDDVTGDGYRVYEMGNFVPDGNTQLYIATLNNPTIEKIYLDRILLIRE